VSIRSIYSRERASSSFAERVYASTQVRVSVNTHRKTSARVLAANTRSESVNTYFAWRGISVVSEELSMKLGTNIHHASWHRWKFSKVRCQMSMYQCVNSITAMAYISTLWRQVHVFYIVMYPILDVFIDTTGRLFQVPLFAIFRHVSQFWLCGISDVGVRMMYLRWIINMRNDRRI